MFRKNKEEHIPHPSQDESCRFPYDQILRKHGFSISQRNKQEEPVWEKRGKFFVQSVALAIIRETSKDVIDF